MFDVIAERYDLLNRLISLGVDQSWRRKTVASLELAAGAQVLDLATGTGDLALLTAERHPGAHVVGLDPSPKMLAVARQKVERAGLGERIELVQGDAEALPFADDTFQGVTMAFGIRNVPGRERALAEMARVTRPGGKVAILELSEPRRGLLQWAARFHMHTVVPFVGGLLSGRGAYRYLPQSIAAFPPPGEFAAMMQRAGLVQVRGQALTFGVCQLYVGAAP